MPNTDRAPSALQSAIASTLIDLLSTALDRGEHAVALDLAQQLADVLRGGEPRAVDGAAARRLGFAA